MTGNLMEGLAAIGAMVLVGVLGQGLWRARKAKPRQAEGAEDGRLEPSMAPGDASLAPISDEDHGAGAPLPELRSVGPRKTARLDPLIDAIACLHLDTPISGELALAHLPPTRRLGTKPFLIEGLNADRGTWELPATGQQYSEFQAGVQLANRGGALSQIEYSEFVQKVQGFADGVGALAEWPDMVDAVARGRELDAFAGAHDAQLNLSLRANGAAWSVGYLQQCAQHHGFVAGGLPGRLVLPGVEDGSPPMLVLSFDAQAAMAEDPGHAAVRELQLSLDVPQTPASAEPFPAWHQVARLLAAEMDASMIDDSGHPILLHAFATIGEDLAKLYQAMAARDLAAGSAAARRLFS